jgi:23S rRNA pseudouridine2457 synthase
MLFAGEKRAEPARPEDFWLLDTCYWMRVIAFNKPYGVVSHFTSREGKRTLAEFISVKNVYPIGRLDEDSEGLLLLTDSGALENRLSDPKFDHPKTYLAQIERLPDESAFEALRQGVVIQGYKTKPAQVKLLEGEPTLPPRDPPIRFRKSVPTAWLEITLTEGKNRQVRRMTAAVGHPTLRLVRVAIAGVTLGELSAGQWRELKPQETKTVARR